MLCDNDSVQQPDTCIRNARGEWIPTNGTKDTPLFRWPPRVAQSLKWVFSYPGFLWPWSTIYLLITIFIWFHFQPAVPRCVDLKPGWIALLFLRNLGLAWAIYGGWHLLLYVLKLQGTNRKYDIRWPSRNDPKFLFRNQTLDNIFWSCASGCTIWTAYEVIYFWALANKKVPYVDWRLPSRLLRRLALPDPLLARLSFLLGPPPHPLASPLQSRPLSAPQKYQPRPLVRPVHAPH